MLAAVPKRSEEEEANYGPNALYDMKKAQILIICLHKNHLCFEFEDVRGKTTANEFASIARARKNVKKSPLNLATTTMSEKKRRHTAAGE
jgi:hypothetical protein